MERTVFWDENGFRQWRRGLVRDIDQRRAGRLCKNRRRFAGNAEIECADVKRFEQLRAAGKLGPFHGKAERLKVLLQKPARFEKEKGAVFLITDPDRLICGICRRNNE